MTGGPSDSGGVQVPGAQIPEPGIGTDPVSVVGGSPEGPTSVRVLSLLPNGD